MITITGAMAVPCKQLLLLLFPSCVAFVARSLADFAHNFMPPWCSPRLPYLGSTCCLLLVSSMFLVLVACRCF